MCVYIYIYMYRKKCIDLHDDMDPIAHSNPTDPRYMSIVVAIECPYSFTVSRRKALGIPVGIPLWFLPGEVALKMDFLCEFSS